MEADRQRCDALLWNFAVLGEAAGQLSAEVKEKSPDISWQQPIRLRNRIVHGYWSVDLEVLHTTAIEQLPAFTASLRRVLSSIADGALHTESGFLADLQLSTRRLRQFARESPWP
ncbi:MAG: HepT-like ribonuclease domain-containing protein [Trebonia sp.]